MSRPTQLGTVAGMTGFIGILPLLLTTWVAFNFDLPALVLTLVHMALMVLGAWAFAQVFGN